MAIWKWVYDIHPLLSRINTFRNREIVTNYTLFSVQILKARLGGLFSQHVDWYFKSTQNWDQSILDFLNNSKTPSHYGFPLTNLQSVSIVDYVPNGASWSILLKILDLWGRMREVWIFIDFNVLEDKLHYCKKSCAIFMIVCFHLLCLALGLFLAGDAKFRSGFLSPEYRFLFETLGACIITSAFIL
jgi:hypothetical protein